VAAAPTAPAAVGDTGQTRLIERGIRALEQLTEKVEDLAEKMDKHLGAGQGGAQRGQGQPQENEAGQPRAAGGLGHRGGPYIPDTSKPQIGIGGGQLADRLAWFREKYNIGFGLGI
jgi:hypothetical protein